MPDFKAECKAVPLSWLKRFPFEMKEELCNKIRQFMTYYF